MWPRKSNPDTRRRSRAKADALPLLLTLLVSACGADDPAPAPSGALRIRVAPLHDYAWLDRRDTGQPVDMKPAAEREALIRDLAAPPAADLLILRGIGSEASLHHLQAALREAGADYRALYLPGPDVYRGLGLLHRRPGLAPAPGLDPTPYSIGDRDYLPMFGSARLSRSDGRNLLLVNAQLPEPDAPYERRRNEARLLMQTLRDPLRNGEEVLLSLHSREDPDSPMMRMLTDLGLVRLWPADERGDHWTHRDPDGVVYRQDQWLFASPALAGRLPSQGRVLDSPDLRAAGPYRHQLIELP